MDVCPPQLYPSVATAQPPAAGQPFPHIGGDSHLVIVGLVLFEHLVQQGIGCVLSFRGKPDFLQLYEILQINCEPYPPIPCTSGDIVAVCGFE